MHLRISGFVLGGIALLFPDAAAAHFTLVQPPSSLATEDGGKGPPPCGEGVASGIVSSVQGGHLLTIKLVETVIHPGHYRVALSVNSRAELPVDPNVVTDPTGLSVSAAIQNPVKIPVLADGLFVHTTAPENATWQTNLMLPNINCARYTLQVIEFMAEHGPNAGGGYFYHHCADLQITADPAVGPIDTQWTQPINVTISPVRVSLKPGTTQQFTASVAGAGDMTVIWTATNGAISSSGLYTAPAGLGTYTVTATSVADATKTASVAVNVSNQNERLYFAHFANGSQSGTSIITEMTLVPLVGGSAAFVTIEINDDTGSPLNTNMNGTAFPGRTDVIIPADGVVTLRTDGQGQIQTGSIVLNSDVKLSALILFRGSIGLIGVADSKPLRRFAVPVRVDSGTNTGVALMGLEQGQTVQLELRTPDGNLVSKAGMPLAAKAHLSRFINQFPWNSAVDFSNFSGKVTLTGTADLAATAIVITPTGSAAVPVAEIP